MMLHPEPFGADRACEGSGRVLGPGEVSGRFHGSGVGSARLRVGPEWVAGVGEELAIGGARRQEPGALTRPN